MEDSFKVRVDRAFGSLEVSSSTKSTPSSLSSLWCLTDEEIQRNEWIRDKLTPHKHEDQQNLRLKNPKPYFSFLENPKYDSSSKFQPSTSNQDLESDIQELDDEDEDDSEDEKRQPQLYMPDNRSNEDWDIRSSMGMDCTLDNEEEEDAYDKVAVGMEESAERFYMRDVNDYEVEIDSNNELPNSFMDVIKDPRANHKAAKLRLKEDDESARSENQIQTATKSKKRVCFDPDTKGNNEVAVASFVPQDPSSVPDYVRNPSNYTHYTFDSLDDVDEESNRKAYLEFFNLLKRSDCMETQDDVHHPTDLPTSIIFTSKKKSIDGWVKNSKVDENTLKKVVSIVAEDVEDVMDEDEPETTTNKSGSLQKGGRRYRTKGSASVDEELG